MSLTSIYTELHRQAARTGTDRAQDLKGGARLAVRVLEGVVTLTIARKGKKLGATEIEVFKRDCNVPETASCSTLAAISHSATATSVARA
jgi:hypothetical protein